MELFLFQKKNEKHHGSEFCICTTCISCVYMYVNFLFFMLILNRILALNRDLGDNETMIKKRESALIPRGLWWSCALLCLRERHRGARVLSCCSLQLVTFYTDPWCYPVILFCDDATAQAEWQWHSCGWAAGCLTVKCVWDRDDSVLVDSASWDPDLVKPGNVFYFLH